MLFVAVLVGYFSSGVAKTLTLATLQEQRQSWVAWHHASPWSSVLLFGLADFAVAAFSIPAAAVMTLAAGAIFEFWTALVVVSLASNLGATLAFIAARWLFAAPVRRLLGDRAARVELGMAEQGGFYLFAMRLTPLFPFWVINLAMGITQLRYWTFLWVSVLGTTPGRVLYLLAGRQLGELRSVNDIVAVPVLALLVALGLFPFAARLALRRLRPLT